MFNKTTKTIFAGIMAGSLIFGGAGSVSAATTATNDVNATINGGDLELTVDSDAINLSTQIDHRKDKMDVTADKTLNYNAIDNRGVEEESDVQMTLTPFTHDKDGSELALYDKSNYDLQYGTPKKIDHLNPAGLGESDSAIVKQVDGQIDLGDLQFSTNDFVKAGDYSATLTTEVVSEPNKDSSEK